MIHQWHFRLIYQMFAKLLSWLMLRATADTAKEIEILVLRHQLAVLQQPCYASSSATTRHYNGHRPHRTLGQAAPSRPLPHRTRAEPYKVRRRDRCSGRIHEYQQVA